MVIKNALADKDQLLTMGTAARQWVVKNHVPGARGRYLIEETLRSSRPKPDSTAMKIMGYIRKLLKFKNFGVASLPHIQGSFLTIR